MKYIVCWCYKNKPDEVYHGSPISLASAQYILNEQRRCPWIDYWMRPAPEPPPIETSGYVEIIGKEPLP